MKFNGGRLDSRWMLEERFGAEEVKVGAISDINIDMNESHFYSSSIQTIFQHPVTSFSSFRLLFLFEIKIVKRNRIDRLHLIQTRTVRDQCQRSDGGRVWMVKRAWPLVNGPWAGYDKNKMDSNEPIRVWLAKVSLTTSHLLHRWPDWSWNGLACFRTGHWVVPASR